MKLVKDLYACTVALFASSGVLDVEGSRIKPKTIKFIPGDHLITDVIGDVVPRLINIWPVSDILGCDLGRRHIVPGGVVLNG